MFDEDKKNEDSTETKEGSTEQAAEKPKGSDVFESHHRSRVREIDFKSLEDTLSAHPLSPFELKVRDKLAKVQSPLDLLIAKEDEIRRRISARTKLGMLVREANLGCMQLTYYELLLDGVSFEEASLKFGISVNAVRQMHHKVLRKLRRAALDRNNGGKPRDPSGQGPEGIFSRENSLKKSSQNRDSG